MKLVGLTGTSGSGKSYICRLLSAHGIPSIDCDRVAREATAPNSPCTRELAKAFGAEFIDAQGALKRRALAAFAFASPERTALLNRITHKYIIKACEEEIVKAEQAGHRVLILDAPTLFESGLDRRCDRIIAVLSERALRIERILERDSISLSDAEQRLDAQKTDEFFASHADYVIYNNGQPTLSEEICRLAHDLLDT